MIRFRIYKTNYKKEFLMLMDLLANGNYKNVMAGPFSNLVIGRTGIIIDGKGEKKLADDYEAELKVNNIIYQREDQYGIIFYQNRKE